MNYLAIATDESRPPLSTETLVDEILRRWPDARIESEEGTYSITWRVDSENGSLAGGLFRDGRGLGLDGNLEELSDLVIWFQRVIGGPVSFLDHVYCGTVEVQDDTTAPQLVREYLASAR